MIPFKYPLMHDRQGPLLVISPVRWDEACFSVPSVSALIAAGLDPLVLCAEEMREFWQSIPGLEVMTHEPKAKAKSITADLFAKNFHSALMWEDSAAADATRLAKIGNRIGPAIKSLKKILTQAITIDEAATDHRVRFYLQTTMQMGVESYLPEFFAPLVPPAASRGDQILLCPDSDFGSSHEWRHDRWLAIARDLIDAGEKLLLIRTNTGRQLASRMAEALGDAIECKDIAAAHELFPLFMNHRFFIGTDGSMPHLASHFGATCIVLFGPNDPQWKRPLGKRHTVLRHHVECAPCLLAKCPLDLRCQNELVTARVAEAIRDAIDATK
jgi:heptosyltransferase-2